MKIYHKFFVVLFSVFWAMFSCLATAGSDDNDKKNKTSVITAVDTGARPLDSNSGGSSSGSSSGGIVLPTGPVPIAGLSENQLKFFNLGIESFSKARDVGMGLGPRFNLDSCVGCHAHPVVGGSSPALNPQVLMPIPGDLNVLPSFIVEDGPVLEARFVKNANGTPDGGVHELFVISGRPEAPNCDITQPDFDAQLIKNNVVFRIPTPTFGLGLVEMLNEDTLYANLSTNLSIKNTYGITPRLNTNGNDGTVTRFGWKAQNKSLLMFAGEAYNVEMGISNDLFQSERENKQTCQFKSVPNDFQNMDAVYAGSTEEAALLATTSTQSLATFSQFLAAPVPVYSYGTVTAASIASGKELFSVVGCNECHTPTLTTDSNASVSALKEITFNPYSDFALHNMGPGLADGIAQGAAKGDEFRSAPLWGLGQRLFFLHDGRAKDLQTAIQAHQSSRGNGYQASEANAVINKFKQLSADSQQNVINFLRSL